MLGHKAREFKQHKSISLEDLVPDDNFYRQVQRTVDLSFVRELVDEFYASMGRPSISSFDLCDRKGRLVEGDGRLLIMV